MPSFASKSRLPAALAAILACAAAFSPAQGADAAIPNFTFADSGWLLTGGTNFRPPADGSQGPIGNDPEYPYVGNNDGGQPTERISNAADPNLKPWAAEAMRKHNELVLGGRRSFVAQARCWPGGTPAQLLFPAEPVFFIQTPKIVYIVWQRDHHVRRIYMDRPHSDNPKPSWFGESVGRYENGELVIDTIGIAEREFGFVDNFRTPHTGDLHVVERWKPIDDGNRLEANVTVEDPGTFNRPWSGTARWNKVDRGPMIESVCAENNANFFDLDEYPMPEAAKADF